MVSIEELRQVLHDEKMALKMAETEKKCKEIKKREAEDKELFRLREHWTGLKATTVDVARDITPPRSKILEVTEAQDRLVNAHAIGYLHGLYIRLGVVALLGIVYVI